ncbi:ABC transporter ATP-binding protein [Pseudomonadales bacterium]|nr:ABC transporter ATP-binding protein [Pseudomonadales bacterium]
MIRKLWQHLNKKRRTQLLLLLILMLLASIMEVVSIGAVVPFLGALTSPETIFKYKFIQPIIETLQITEPNQLLLPLTTTFVIATLTAAAVRLILLYTLTRFSYAVGADFSINIYRRTLYQDYSVHISRNSSEVINGIINKTNIVIGGILAPTMTLISSIVIMVGIITMVFIVNPFVASISFSCAAFIYLIINLFARKHLQRNSDLIAKKSTQMIKSLQEGLGGVRDVLIDGTQEFYCDIYQNADLPMRRANASNVFIGTGPRYMMEAFGMVLIGVLAYTLTLEEGGLVAAIPTLGALAIGAQKLLPTLQQAYASISAINGSKSSFNDVLLLLDQPLPLKEHRTSKKIVSFEESISFKNVSFRYTDDTPWILKNVNLSFKRGEKVGIVGVTGSGKSTLLDVLMGLLAPTSGELLIDGVAIEKGNRGAWQAHISHVPQSIYLADTTIQENIAFGVVPEEVQESRVILAAQKAQIAETINSLKSKYKALVGERGVQLSGGQRQRVGIARALYKDSALIIFDEATSALDNQTEQKIMKKIGQMNKNQTMFFIAHRLTTLKQCDTIIRINEDFTIDEIRYEDLET